MRYYVSLQSNCSEPFFFENGYFPGSILFGTTLLNLTMKGFVILLSVGVEIFHFEIAYFQDVVIKSKLVGYQWHHRWRTIKQNLIIPPYQRWLSVQRLQLFGQQSKWNHGYLSASILTSLTFPPRSQINLVRSLRKATATEGWTDLVMTMSS